MSRNLDFPIRIPFVAALLLTFCWFTHQAAGEPTNLGKRQPIAEPKDEILEERYQTWVEGLSPQAQSWERVLQRELGGFYLPAHQRDMVAGKTNAWSYVEDDPALPRVLLIGDSISRGYTQAVRKKLAGKANVHRAPANCGPVHVGLEKLDIWLGEGQWDVIHFNFGIHDRHTPLDTYSQQLEQFVQRLEKSGATLIWANSTPMPEMPQKGISNAQIVRHNEAAAKVMKEHEIAIDDLYSVIEPHVDRLQRPNDVHFYEEGYALLGAAVAESLLVKLERP